MREIPSIVKELKESEAQGQLSSFKHSSESFQNHQMVQNDDGSSSKIMGFSEELRKLNRDSYAFQNLEVFLSTCDLVPNSIQGSLGEIGEFHIIHNGILISRGSHPS